MTNRRDFLQAAAVLTCAPLTSRAGLPADYALTLSAAIVDERFDAARAFGAHSQQAGITVRSIAGDITELWLTELRPQWNRKPAAITGLTARPALFCLEQLGWEHRMRVKYHAEHRVQGSHATHTVHVAGRGLSAAALEAAGAAWPGYSARAISRLSAGSSTCGPSAACMEASVGDDQITLHSWVIA